MTVPPFVLRLATAILLTACTGRDDDVSSGTAQGLTRDSSMAKHAAVDTLAGTHDDPLMVPSPGKQAAGTTVPPVPPGPRANARTTARPGVGPRPLTFNGVDLSNIGYARGNPDSPVVIMDFSDFGCPYCGVFARETYPVIEREYVRTGKVYYKYMPFIAGFAHGREATRAAECAGEQEKFWEMHDRIYDTQAEWRRGSAIDAQMAALAGTIPLDSVRYATCYRDRHTEARTAQATALANELGVRVTPSFLVNERPVQGALPIAEFRKVIEAALLLARTER